VLQIHVKKPVDTTSSGHRIIWWGDATSICNEPNASHTGPYCVNQSLSHTYIYEETSLSWFRRSLSDKTGQTLALHCYGTNKQCDTTRIWRSHWRRRRYQWRI